MLLSTVVSLNRSKTSGGNQSAIRVNKILYTTVSSSFADFTSMPMHVCTYIYVYYTLFCFGGFLFRGIVSKNKANCVLN